MNWEQLAAQRKTFRIKFSFHYWKKGRQLVSDFITLSPASIFHRNKIKVRIKGMVNSLHMWWGWPTESVVSTDRPCYAPNGPKTKLIASRLPASKERGFLLSHRSYTGWEGFSWQSIVTLTSAFAVYCLRRDRMEWSFPFKNT